MSERLFKRNKVWYGQYYDFQGRRHSRSTKCSDIEAAKACLREWERRATDPTYAAPNETSLEDALKDLLQERRKAGGD